MCRARNQAFLWRLFYMTVGDITAGYTAGGGGGSLLVLLVVLSLVHLLSIACLDVLSRLLGLEEGITARSRRRPIYLSVDSTRGLHCQVGVYRLVIFVLKELLTFKPCSQSMSRCLYSTAKRRYSKDTHRLVCWRRPFSCSILCSSFPVARWRRRCAQGRRRKKQMHEPSLKGFV